MEENLKGHGLLLGDREEMGQLVCKLINLNQPYALLHDPLGVWSALIPDVLLIRLDIAKVDHYVAVFKTQEELVEFKLRYM